MNVKVSLYKNPISNMIKNTEVLRNAVNPASAFESSHIHLNISEVLPLFRRQDGTDTEYIFFI